MKQNKEHLHYFMSSMMIVFSIAIIISAMEQESVFIRLFGLVGAALFMGIGLLPFPIRNAE